MDFKLILWILTLFFFCSLLMWWSHFLLLKYFNSVIVIFNFVSVSFWNKLLRLIFMSTYSWMCGLPLAHHQLIRSYSFWENYLSLYQQLIITIHSVARDEMGIELSSPCMDVIRLGLTQVCACCDDSCGFACTASLVGLENILF